MGSIYPTLNASVRFSFQTYVIICSCFTCSEMAKGETPQEKVGTKPVKKKNNNNNARSAKKTKRIYCILCRKFYMNHVSGSTSSAELYKIFQFVSFTKDL